MQYGNMNLKIAAVGKLKPGPERQLFDKYLERVESAGRSLHFVFQGVIELAESKAQKSNDRKKQEGDLLMEKIGKDYSIVLLDEKGKNLTSRQFSRKLETIRDDGVSGICFVIGGPDGLSQNIRQKAFMSLSLGLMTLPHGIARIVLAEQIYRSIAIISGHPYHRD